MLQVETHTISRKHGIQRTREFEKKKLATHGVNTGMLKSKSPQLACVLDMGVIYIGVV